MDKLNIVSFRKKKIHPNAFPTVQSETGLKSVTIDDKRLIQKLISDQTDINLFVFDDPGICNDEIYQMTADAIKRNVLSANLCLSYSLPTKNCDLFLSQFDDLLFWPFKETELGLRIKRYRSKHRQNKPSFKRKAFDNFAELNLVGRTAIFTQILDLIKRLAQYDVPVLIEGETGTGKENVARAIHYLSNRKDHNFVPLNCGAIQDNLLEAELFGHEKGAFTDAKTRQVGLVGIAQQGTLFLDEVDCLSPKAQVALLRFLQTREYRPLGSNRTYHSDIRVLAATNSDLQSEILHNQFREDLYFRLNVLNVSLPTLRDRKSDIPLIAEKLISDYAAQYNLTPKKLSASTIEYLISQPWPGNIRELENVMLRAFLLTDDPIIDICQDNYRLPKQDDLHKLAQLSDTTGLKFQEAKSIVIEHFEQDYLSKILNKTEGNITKAAAIAGKERRAIGKLLKKYNMDRSCFVSKPSEV